MKPGRAAFNPTINVVCLHRASPMFVHWAYKHIKNNVFKNISCRRTVCGAYSSVVVHNTVCVVVTSHEFTRAIDATLNERKLLQYVAYPAFLDATESETSSMATPFFRSGIGRVCRDVFFKDRVFRVVEWTSFHAWWFPVALGCILLLKE